MAYRRRYYLPFVGTTETIGDKSITTDKIGDTAVAERHIAIGAVTSQKIKDDTIVSEDIKASAVETSDIKNAAVTEPKLADGAVTTYKLGYQSVSGSKIKPATITSDKMAVPQVARPLTPGVDTAEIQDAKVTAAKLAPDAVETSKIKDLNVTNAKIANDTITNAKIAANAVKGAEIGNGAVGTDKLATDAVETVKIKDANVTHDKLAVDAVEADNIKDGEVTHPKLATDAVEADNIKDGEVTRPKLATDAVEEDNIKDGEVTHPKLATDAVETDNILDANVIEPKLEDDFLLLYLKGKQVFYDDFLGSVLGDAWTVSGDAGGVVGIEDGTDSQIHIATSGNINEAYRINWNDKRGISVANLPRFFTRIFEAPTNVKYLIGLYENVDNYMAFRADTGVSNNWKAVCRTLGAETEVDTGIALSATKKNLEIKTVNVGEILFYIDEVLKATINTNIPTGRWLQSLFEIEALVADTKLLDIDVNVISLNRL